MKLGNIAGTAGLAAIAVALGLSAAAPMALAAGDGGHFWLQQNHAYARAHPIRAQYVCRVPGKNYTVLRTHPCRPGLQG